jgi:hypothetical protein
MSFQRVFHPLTSDQLAHGQHDWLALLRLGWRSKLHEINPVADDVDDLAAAA